MPLLPPNHIRRRLTRRYAVALAVIALMGVGTATLALTSLEQRAADGHIVNTAGRQRMLSQRVAKGALAVHHAAAPAAAFEALDADIDEWVRSGAATDDADSRPKDAE